MRYHNCRVWESIHTQLAGEERVLLMYVLDSQGSSPGRRGFAMAVMSNGQISGTIGGGIMEHKLVELAKSMLIQNTSKVILKTQHHSKEQQVDQSGMICSGSQKIALVPLGQSCRSSIDQITAVCKNNEAGNLHIGPAGLKFVAGPIESTVFNFATEKNWSYTEPLGDMPRIHIVGAGHVGLALSEVMSMLGFYVMIYDDRSQLNTLEQNQFAHQKTIVDYGKIDEAIPGNDNDYVVIMTFGYRSDKTVLLQLIGKPFYYIGMMGSDKKIEALYNELDSEGFGHEHLAAIHAPIGVNILSKTAKEIAVSIAAEIILEKNKFLPTGRVNTNR